MCSSFFPIRLNRVVFIGLSLKTSQPVKTAIPYGFCRRRFSSPVYYTLYNGKAFYLAGTGF
jgi:hypothetical protein